MSVPAEPRPATDDDVPAVVALVQSAYRGDASRAGWTTEADLLEGQRTDDAMVRALLAAPGSTVLVLAEGPAEDGPLLACCHLQERPDGSCYVGMLAVRPDAQSRGLGRAMLGAAEARARAAGARRLEMTVIAQRADLIAWYERLGFVDTGERSPFPYGDERFGLPRRADLEFRHLARPLTDLTRTAVVTGAGRGIGRELALGLARRGWSLGLVSRTPERLEETAALVAQAGTAAVVTEAVDLTDAAATRAAAGRLEAALGGVGLLVNNAGVLERREAPFADDDVEDAWRVVEGTLRVAMNATHALLPGMLARGGGRVVSVNSGFGYRSGPAYTGYQVGKGALARFTSSVDAQYRDRGIRAFDLAPGVVPTDMSTAMPMHAGRTDWTPVEAVVDLLAAIGDGRLDPLSGRFLRAGADTAEALAARADDILAADARRLRLVPWGPDDPMQA